MESTISILVNQVVVTVEWEGIRIAIASQLVSNVRVDGIKTAMDRQVVRNALRDNIKTAMDGQVVTDAHPANIRTRSDKPVVKTAMQDIINLGIMLQAVQCVPRGSMQAAVRPHAQVALLVEP